MSEGSQCRLRLQSSRFAAVLLVIPLCVYQGQAIGQAIGSDYDVTINTSSLSGDASTLAFDFIAGGAFSNTVTISDFSTNGALAANGPNSGSVTGALPGTVTLSDTNFFNEFLQGVTLGSTISFQLNATTNGTTRSALPDTFSFFLLDRTASSSLLTTTDPTGAGSLFSLQIDGSSGGILGNYRSVPAVSATLVPATSGPTTRVPEPSALGLMILGLLGVVFRRCSTVRS